MDDDEDLDDIGGDDDEIDLGLHASQNRSWMRNLATMTTRRGRRRGRPRCQGTESARRPRQNPRSRRPHQPLSRRCLQRLKPEPAAKAEPKSDLKPAKRRRPSRQSRCCRRKGETRADPCPQACGQERRAGSGKGERRSKSAKTPAKLPPGHRRGKAGQAASQVSGQGSRQKGCHQGRSAQNQKQRPNPLPRQAKPPKPPNHKSRLPKSPRLNPGRSAKLANP